LDLGCIGKDGAVALDAHLTALWSLQSINLGVDGFSDVGALDPLLAALFSPVRQ
jgi:hypothetical protein